MVGFLIGCGIAALMAYAVAARPSGRGWAYARLSSLGTAATCAIILGALPLVGGLATHDVEGGGLLVTGYHAFLRLGAFGLLLWLGLVLYLTRAVCVQWQLVRAGEFAGLTELGERAVEVRTLLKETAADRAWITAQMQRTFANQQEGESVLQEIRSREQQIEQRQAKLADLRVALRPWLAIVPAVRRSRSMSSSDKMFRSGLFGNEAPDEGGIMHKYARLSLLSVLLTALMITVNHLYSLGPKALVLGAVLLVGPAALLWWFKNTQSPVAFIGYLLMNLWIVVGFGLIKGLWEGTLRLYLGTLLASLSTIFPKPAIGTYGFEASGILTFIGSLFVAYYAYQLVRTRRAASSTAQPQHVTSRQRVVLATSGLFAIVVVLGAYAWVDQDRWTAPANGIVKIGVIVPKSGLFAILGNSFLKAVQAAQQDLRDTKYEYQLVTVDVGTDPRMARDAIQRAIRDDRVDAIVGGISLFGQVTKPLATAARIPHTCVCSVTSIGDGAYNFTNIPTPEAEAIRWVQEARRRGITRVAMLTGLYPPSIQGHVTAVKAEAAREGVQIIFDQTFDTVTTDFRSAIAGAQASRPDVYYVEAAEPSLDSLAEQLSRAGIHNFASVVAPSVSPNPKLFEGTWYTDSDLRDFGFKTRFEEKYPGMQFATHMMPYAYDDFNMIVQAFERGQNPAVYIRNITAYEGTAGTLIKAPGSGTFQSRPAVWVIRNGKPALLSTH